MEDNVRKYLSNYIINIVFVEVNQKFGIFNDKLHLRRSISKNDHIFKIIINSIKYLSIEFRDFLYSYENIDILSYANEIYISDKIISKKNIINIIDQSLNSHKLIVNYSHIEDMDIICKLHEKQNLKYIKIITENNMDIFYIYAIIKIKSLDVIHFKNDEFASIGLDKILKILYYVINNRNKDIKIIIEDYYISYVKLKNYLKFVSYNFKVRGNEYIFTCIPRTFAKFNNLYDFNLYY